MEFQRLLPENWLKVILRSDVDDLISLYKTTPSFRNILNDKYTLKLLLDNYRIKPSEEVTSFNDFIAEYDENYASERCESQQDIRDCIYNASSRGQLYWVYYYLEKDPNNLRLIDNALRGSATGNDVELAQWLINTYSIIINQNLAEGMMLHAIRNNSLQFIKFLITSYPDIFNLDNIVNMLNRNTKSIEGSIYLLEYLDKAYPNWNPSERRNDTINFILFLITKNNIESGKYYLSKYPQGIIGYLIGLSVRNINYFISELKYSESSLNIDDFITFYAKHPLLFTMRNNPIGWILINYNPKITSAFLKILLKFGDLETFEIFLKKYHDQISNLNLDLSIFKNNQMNNEGRANKLALYLSYHPFSTNEYNQIYGIATRRHYNYIIDVLNEHPPQ